MHCTNRGPLWQTTKLPPSLPRSVELLLTLLTESAVAAASQSVASPPNCSGNVIDKDTHGMPLCGRVSYEFSCRLRDSQILMLGHASHHGVNASTGQGCDVLQPKAMLTMLNSPPPGTNPSSASLRTQSSSQALPQPCACRPSLGRPLRSRPSRNPRRSCHSSIPRRPCRPSRPWPASGA